MSYATLRSLNQEWSQLVAGSTDVVGQWKAHEQGLSSADDLDDVVRLIADAPDLVLAALMRLGRAGDGRAFRVILQAMLGKVVSECRRAPERFDEAIAELWLAIAEYPLERRPRSILANLGWALHRRLQTKSAPLLWIEPAGPAAAVVLSDAADMGVISAESFHLLGLVYLDGLTSAEAGGVLGISADLVRYRCRKELRRLADRAELLAA